MERTTTAKVLMFAPAGLCSLFLIAPLVYTLSSVLDMFLPANGSPILSSDIWDMELKTLSCGMGFDNIIWQAYAPGPDARAQVFRNGGAWIGNEPAGSPVDIKPLKCNDGSEPTNRMQTAGNGEDQAIIPQLYGVDGSMPNFVDGSPWCFSWPINGATIDKNLIQITLNTGEKISPFGAGILPNSEQNEKHCIVFFADLGNRIVPNGTNDCKRREDATPSMDSCAFYPTEFEIIGDIEFVGPPEGASMADGPWGQDQVQVKSGKGLKSINPPPHPYEAGPTLIGAHLTRYSNEGDSLENDCEHTFAKEFCQYRLRFYYSGGYSPNGVSGMKPTDFANHWRLVANDSVDEVLITETKTKYTVNGGTIEVVGLSELGANVPPKNANCESLHSSPKDSVEPYSGSCYDKCYDEDADNYIDIILMGDDLGMQAIKRLEQPSDGTGCYRKFYDTGIWEDCVGYQPVYNPGGGGNVDKGDQAPDYFKIFTAASRPTSIDVVVDLENHMFVSYDDGRWASVVSTAIILWVVWGVLSLVAGGACCYVCIFLRQDPPTPEPRLSQQEVELASAIAD